MTCSYCDETTTNPNTAIVKTATAASVSENRYSNLSNVTSTLKMSTSNKPGEIIPTCSKTFTDQYASPPPTIISSRLARLLDKFELFPKLPIELRLKIYKLHQKPRTVEIRFQWDGRKTTHRFAANIPSLLHICGESRIEALKWYKITFANSRALNSVYFDNSIDTFYLPHHGTDNQKFRFIYLTFGDIKQLRSLAIGEDDFKGFFLEQLKPPRIIPRRIVWQASRIPFERLEEITIVQDGRFSRSAAAHQKHVVCTHNRTFFVELDHVLETCLSPYAHEECENGRTSIDVMLKNFQALVGTEKSRNIIQCKPALNQRAVCEKGFTCRANGYYI